MTTGFGFTGGDANQQITTASGQSLVVNANPLFQYGNGNPSNATSGAASADNAATQAPSLTDLRGSSAFPGTSSPVLASPLGAAPSSSLLLIIGIGALALVLSGGGEGRHR